MSKKEYDDISKIRSNSRREYDAEKIAEEIIDWVKHEDSINLTQFCADRGYTSELINRLVKKHDFFSYAYKIVKMKLAERRERLVNAELLNYGSYNRYQPVYDPFLHRFEEKQKNRDAARKKDIVKEDRLTLAKMMKLASEGEISQKD